MAVTLSGLPCISPFDCIGEPATLAQRWDKWKAEFELYVAASGVEDKLQKRALLLHLAGTGVREIFKTYPDEVKGDAKEFDKAMTCLSNHFEVKKNVPLARQKLLASKPNPGETINNFFTRLKRLAEHCNYGEEEDNQVRDIVIFHVTNKELKSKFYREENLSLSKLLEIVSTYHNKDAMILVSENTVNRTWEDRGKSDKGMNRKQPWQGKCWRCAKPGHMAKDCKVSRKHTCGKCGNRGHMEVCCRKKQDKQGKESGDSGPRGKFGRKRDGVRKIVQPPRDQATEAEWQVLLRERYAQRKLREKEYADSKRHATTSDITEGDLILLRQNRENKLSPTFEPEPYRAVEKNGNAVVIESSAGQSKMRNAGHMKKFEEPGSETGAREIELPATSATTDTPKEVVISGQDPAGGIQQKTHTQSVPLPLSPAQEGLKSRPVRKRETPKWMKDFVCQ